MPRYGLPEDEPAERLRTAVAAEGHLGSLRRRGLGAAECERVERIFLGVLPALVEVEDKKGRFRADTVRELDATCRGRSLEARDQRPVLLGFAKWLEGALARLTDERVAELVVLEGRPGSTAPFADDVALLLRAATRQKTAEGTRLAVAMCFAGYHGLRGAEICGLRVGAIDWTGGTALLRLERTYRMSMHEWEQHYLGTLASGCGPNDYLLRTVDGQPLRPRYLQQQVAALSGSPGEHLREPLTLERLQDHAATWCLDNGGTLREVSRMLGFTRVANVRRRFGREPWAGLADRDDNRFTIEAAAEADGVPLEVVCTWPSEGLRHEVRGDRTYVGKEDMRSSGRRPMPGVQSPEAALREAMAPTSSRPPPDSSLDAVVPLFGQRSLRVGLQPTSRSGIASPYRRPSQPTSCAPSQGVSPRPSRL